MTDSEYEGLKMVLSWVWMAYFGTGINGRAQLTNLMPKVFQFINEKIKYPEENPRWIMLSAHDSQLVPLMGAFNMSSTSCILKLIQNN